MLDAFIHGVAVVFLLLVAFSDPPSTKPPWKKK